MALGEFHIHNQDDEYYITINNRYNGHSMALIRRKSSIFPNGTVVLIGYDMMGLS